MWCIDVLDAIGVWMTERVAREVYLVVSNTRSQYKKDYLGAMHVAAVVILLLMISC